MASSWGVMAELLPERGVICEGSITYLLRTSPNLLAPLA